MAPYPIIVSLDTLRNVEAKRKQYQCKIHAPYNNKKKRKKEKMKACIIINKNRRLFLEATTWAFSLIGIAREMEAGPTFATSANYAF